MWKRINIRRIATTTGAALGLMLSAGCSLGLTDVQDPSSILDPDIVKSQNGAVSLYRAALTHTGRVYAGFPDASTGGGGSYAVMSGLAADEYNARTTGGVAWFNLRRVEALGAGNQDQPFTLMNTARLYIDEATGALRQYGVTTPKAYLAEMQALQGYLYVMFGELYCSGVPFSKAVYGGDIVLGKPLTTEEIFNLAIIYFDSAITSATDSLPIKRLAWVGKARALVNLKRYADAAAVASAANVPTSFRYTFQYQETPLQPHYLSGTSPTSWTGISIRMANRAGINGLEYLEAGDTVAGGRDPRMKWFSAVNSAGEFPEKFRSQTLAIPLADGIEARLIEAEARLASGDTVSWANVLNTLRQSALSTPIPALTADSTSGASAALRVTVMFRERAFWLFGTGHRFGDMRRLVRQYGRTVHQVFPTGAHATLPTPDNTYSDLPVIELPKKELESNPYYQGCFNHDA